ncbi:transglycosylase family protein [Ornithinimicrobium pratense]|uniref:SH3 domain-containing protein n=1 Tax=Ornithinimicrobium pratense TaxID=2593973 RepID=A0A5J6V844_9MICO|nr:transglycosylase family protein [Ornithinimicrobium pratense]QFG69514.1 SH3 domain-containing protein [Ornithinimicrobium pratense]
MARPAQHRAPATRARSVVRRAGYLGLASAASLATVGLTAPAASAHNHNVWDRVAQCESTGNWHINTGNGYYGGLQFYQPTWVGFGGQEFAAYAHQATKLQQIQVAQRVLQVQGPGAWPVCSVRAGLTLQNGSQPYPGTEDPAPPTPPPGETGTWWVSAGAGANIRSGPGTHFAVVGSAARGTQVVGTASNGWVRISDGRGWVSLTTLTTSNPGTPTPPPAPPTPPPSDPTPPPGETGTWQVSASVGANIRSGPGLNHRVVGGAARGTQVTGAASNGWVKLSDGRGWISLTTLAPVGSPTPPPSPAPPGEASTYRVSAPGGANIRSGPGTNHSVIGGAGHGTQLRGTPQSNGWIKLADRNGFVYSGIVSKVG